jgi:circadian clock protein KaiC
MDTWLLVRENEASGERNRTLYVLKSRGMDHSNQLREMLLTPEGIRLVDPYLGLDGALTGAARLAQEAKEKAMAMARQQEIERRRREMDRRRQALEARIAALRLEFESEEDEARKSLEQELAREETLLEARKDMARVRKMEPTVGLLPEKEEGRA